MMRQYLTLCANARAALVSAAHKPSLSTNKLSARTFFSFAQEDPTGRPALEMGQPTHHSHPDLLLPGELTPGIPSAEYASRRQSLVELLKPGGSALLAASPTVYMAGVIPYPYRQSSDFFYLTGITQPGVAMILERHGTSYEHTYTLFVPDPDAHAERWNGWRLDKQGAETHFGAHQVAHLSELGGYLSKLVSRSGNYEGTSTGKLSADGINSSNGSSLTYQVGHEGSEQAAGVLRSAPSHRVSRSGVQHLTHRMRWHKSPNELLALEKSAIASALALRKCIAISSPGVSENTLQAVFEYETRRMGAVRMAYPPVVAGGASGNIIHYSRNDKTVPHGELVTMDAGGELHGYVSDITRSWPVSGKFTSAQLDVYEAVLSVHQSCLEGCKAGNTLRELHAFSVTALCDALKQLGLPQALYSKYRRFYPHALGHWLGLDTHDTPLVTLDTPMRPGVVLTIEPGLYLPDCEDIPKGLRGIGIRLEDDIAITSEGPRLLSRDVPIDPKEIEALVGTQTL